MFDFFTRLMASSYKTPGTTSNHQKMIKSLVGQKVQNTSNVDIESVEKQLFFSPTNVKESVKNYSLTRQILDIVSTTASDIINKSSFTVQVSGLSIEKNKEINDFLIDINLRNIILDNLDDAIYEGSYSWYIEKAGDKYSSRELLHPHHVVQVTRKGKIYKYLPHRKMDTDESDYFSNKKKLIDPINIGFLSFKTKSIKKLSANKSNYASTELVDISYLAGQGLFEYCYPLLFEHLIKFLMKFLMSIKNSVRSDILVAQTAEKIVDAAATANSIQDIEAMINNSEHLLDFRNSDSMAIISTVYTAILNSTKVVPGLQNFTNFELLQYPDLDAKIIKLDEDMGKVKLEIGNLLGIPDELISGGSNRWEVLSRSSRFLTLIESILNDITICVKQIVYNYITESHKISSKGKTESVISIDDITISLDTSNVVFNNNFTQKSQLVSDKVNVISTILQSISQIVDLKGVDHEKLTEWAKNQVNMLDPSLGDILFSGKVTAKEALEDYGGEDGTEFTPSPKRGPIR